MSYATPRQIIKAWERKLNLALEKGHFDSFDIKDADYFLTNVAIDYRSVLIDQFYSAVKMNNPELALKLSKVIIKRESTLEAKLS